MSLVRSASRRANEPKTVTLAGGQRGPNSLASVRAEVSRDIGRRGSLARWAVVAGPLILLTSACFHASFDLVLRDDGSGSMSGSVHIDRTVVELVLQMDEDLGLTFEDYCASLERTPLEPEAAGGSDDGYAFASEHVIDDAGCDLTFTTEWPADYADRLMTGFGANGDPLIERSDDGWRFELDMSVIRDLFGFDRNADLFSLIVDQPTLTVSVTLPGEVQEHNADARDGPTFRWHVVMSDLENMPDTLYAGVRQDEGSGSALLIGVVVGVAVLAIVVIAIVLRRRSGDEDRLPVPQQLDEG